MSEFIFAFRTSTADQQAVMSTPDRAQRSMQAWMTWVGELEAAGHLKDPGRPLDRNGKVVRGKGAVVTDGPYIETKDIVLGFMVVEAVDLEQAAGLAAGCPVLEGGGSVEIRPVTRQGR